MEKLYRISEAREILSVSRSKIYKMIKEWDLRTVKVSGMIRIPESSIEEVKEQ